MYQPGKHVYLAAGFFNDDQRAVCTAIENMAEEAGVPLYSPRHDGGVLVPDATEEEREFIFRSNVVAIEVADWVLAVIDDFDPGVIWEMGLAYGKSPTLAFSNVPGRGLNVMLAGSANLGFINGLSELGSLFNNFRAGAVDPFPRNTWSGKIV